MKTLLVFLALFNPLGLPWGVDIKDSFCEVEGFNYYYGDIRWGKLVFTGWMLELETELVIDTSGRQIAEATLIFGPGGIGDNCIKRYKFISKLLDAKYGTNKLQESFTDPQVYDLLFASKCHPVRVGLQEYWSTWTVKNFKIELGMFSRDDKDIFIQISYQYIPLWNEMQNNKRNKLLRKL